MSSLQIALVESCGIAYYILLPRRREDNEVFNQATPKSAQQSNSLPLSLRLLELPPLKMIPLHQIDTTDLAVQVLEGQEGLQKPVLAPLPEQVQIEAQEQEAVLAEIHNQEPLQEIVPEAVQPALVMIPLQELIQEPEERPCRSTRLAKKSDGMYINIVEKVMKKKKKKSMPYLPRLNPAKPLRTLQR
jgi:hypothetical protein